MNFTFTNDGNDKSYENAIEVLFEENYNRVYKKSVSILSDVELAKDATQETFYRAFLKMDTLMDKSKFGSWVNSIAVNVCKRMLKQKINYRRNNISIYDDEGNLRNIIFELIDFYIPDKIYEDTELRQELKKYISKLDIETQQIVNMRFYNEFTIREISRLMNIKEGTVKSKIYRAKQKIADKLRKFIDVERINNNG